MTSARSEAPYDARQVANQLLEVADTRRVGITNMSVNKLVFLAHGHYLLMNARALVHNPFEAWDHGPVAPALYEEFRKFGGSRITTRATMLNIISNVRSIAPTTLTDPDRNFLVEIFGIYGHLDAYELSDLTHEVGGPWHQARQAFERSANFGKRISDEVIRRSFSDLVRH